MIRLFSLACLFVMYILNIESKVIWKFQCDWYDCLFVYVLCSIVVQFEVRMDEVSVDNKKISFFSLIQPFHDSGKALSGGKLVIDVSYFGAGDFVIAHSQVLPGFTPPVSQCSVYSLSMCVYFVGRGNLSIDLYKCRFASNPISNFLNWASPIVIGIWNLERNLYTHVMACKHLKIGD